MINGKAVSVIYTHFQVAQVLVEF